MSQVEGARVWVRSLRHAWVKGTVEERSEQNKQHVFKVRKDPIKLYSDDEDDGPEEEEVVTVVGDSPEISSNPDMYLCNVFEDGTMLDQVEDLTWLTHLHEPSILQALSVRFDKDLIYTNTGPILLAVNPFKRINIYSAELLEMYYSTGLLKSQGLETPKLAPHVFATGDSAYRNLVDATDHASKNQSILVSGESGAGKTESTKFIMQYLATVACDESNSDGQKIADMVLQSNPILEAFGNARTTRNDNSSRFGKFIEMQFNMNGMLVGARVATYLLEKVRLSQQGKGERNFHVFYQLARGASEDKLEAWSVPQLEKCGITNQSECFDRQDNVADDDQFEKMWKAMETMGFPDTEKEQLMRMVSAVMNLGNLEFSADESNIEGASSVLEESTRSALEAAAKLLKVDPDALATSFTTRNVKVGMEWFLKPLSREEAVEARDALAKAIYSRMFNHVVMRINESIEAKAKGKVNFIGVLDIFGFEVFQNNSFEQLCINYANETLQQQFNQFVFKLEQREYEKEKIKWSFIDFPDNQKCLDLIEAKPIGILSLLDEQCLFPRGNDKSLAGKFYEKLTDVERFSVSNKEKVNYHFTVQHYAGDVSYNTFGFISKNKDQLYTESLELMQASTDEFLQLLFPKPKGTGAENSSRVQSKTVGSQFKDQLAVLLKTVRSTTPHYIRCLKPNDVATAGKLVRTRLVDQLRYGGVLEAVKVGRAGYPVRLLLPEFVTRYFMLAGGQKVLDVVKARSDGDGRPVALEIVQELGLEAETEYQLGLTKLFLRKGAYEKMEEARIQRLKSKAVKIQSLTRAIQERKRYRTLIAAIQLIQKQVRGFIGRKRATAIRRYKAASKIKATIRGKIARTRYAMALFAVRKFQSLYRGYKARLKSKSLRTENQAVRIQAWYRSATLRKVFRLKKTTAICVQKLARKAQARMLLKRLRIESREVGTLQTKLQDLTSRVSELEASLETEKAEHEATKQALATLKTSSTSKEISTQPSAPGAGEEQIENLREEIARLGTALSTAKENEKELQSEVEELKTAAATNVPPSVAETEGLTDTRELCSALEASREEIAQLKTALSTANEKEKELQSDVEKLKAAGATNVPSSEAETGLSSALEASRAENERLMKELASVRASQEVVATQNPQEEEAQDSKEKVGKAADNTNGDEFDRAEVAALRHRVEELEAEAAEKAKNQVAQQDMGDLPSEELIKSFQDHIRDLEEQNAALKQEVAFLKENRDTIEAQVERHIEHMCEAENRANSLESNYQKLRKANQNLEDQLAAMETLNQQASGVKIALARRLEQLIKENMSLRSDKTETEDTVRRLEQENSLLANTIRQKSTAN